MAAPGLFHTSGAAFPFGRKRMKAEWLENTDKNVCLCCGQMVLKRGNPITPDRAVKACAIFFALGLTREALLTKHRAQLDYQSPGFAAWLEGN
jgi:hypothetical protein